MLLLWTSSSHGLSIKHSNWLRRSSLKYSLIKGVNDLTLPNPMVISPFLSSWTPQEHFRVYSVLSETLSCCGLFLLPWCHMSRGHGVPGLTVLLIYMFSLVNLTQSHGFKYHFSASDSRACISGPHLSLDNQTQIPNWLLDIP